MREVRRIRSDVRYVLYNLSNCGSWFLCLFPSIRQWDAEELQRVRSEYEYKITMLSKRTTEMERENEQLSISLQVCTFFFLFFSFAHHFAVCSFSLYCRGDRIKRQKRQERETWKRN